MLLWVYIHTGRAWKICPATVGIEPTSLYTTFGILAQSNITNIIFTWVHNTNTEKKIIKLFLNISLIACSSLFSFLEILLTVLHATYTRAKISRIVNKMCSHCLFPVVIIL
jgi:hypothetical protein